MVLSYQMIRLYKSVLQQPLEPMMQESASFLSLPPPTPPARSTSVNDARFFPSRKVSTVRFGQVEEKAIPRKTARELSLQQHPPTPPTSRYPSYYNRSLI